MKNTKLILAASILIFAVAMYSCGGETEAKNKAEVESEIRIKPVKVIKAEERTVSRSIDYSANLIPFDELFIAPASPGRIVRINVNIGDKVSAGQVLVEMDKTQLNQAKLQLSSLERDFQRFDSLIQFGGIPKQQYEQMKTQIDITRENIAFLETNTTITAPFSGIITAKFFENGELFSGAPNTQVGKAAIVILQRISPIKVVIAVSERYFPYVNKGMQIRLRSDIYPDEEFIGKIFRIHPTINPATKTFNVELEINNPKELLRPGMFARVNLELGEETAIMLPSNVVLQQIGTNQRYVFVNDNGTAKRIVVELGSRFDDLIEIVSDKIKVGDQIIVSGHSSLLDKEKISIVN